MISKAIVHLVVLLGSGALAGLLGACGDSPPEGGGPGPSAGCESPEDFFRTKLFPSVLGAKCIVCHSEGGLAASTRLSLRKGTDGASSFESVKALASLAEDGGPPLLVRKPTGAMPHGGGAVVKAGSEEAALLDRFAELLGPGCSPARPSASLGQRQIRRLTRDEYGNTLRDLGVPGTWADKLPPDTLAFGFDNNGAELTVGGLLADQLQSNAEEIGKALDLRPHLGCEAASADATCVAAFLDGFGARAFRRPLTAREKARYGSLFEGVRGAEGPEQGLRSVVTALLQSPGFLYRAELGGEPEGDTAALDPYEIASEISYLLWRSMPDQELFEVARSGRLQEPAVVAEQVERALSSPRASASMRRFVEQWLEIERLEQAQKDAKTYPDYDDQLRSDMRQETLSLFEAVGRSPSGGLGELLTADYTFVTPKLGRFYGMSVGGSSPGGAPRSPAPEGRRGILAHGSVLATHATAASASPVRRGKLVLEKLFCQTVPPPPPGLNAELAAVAPGLSNRERFSAHSKDPVCAGCHSTMDPLGFGFERFDGIGKYMASVDSRGEIKGTPSSDSPFDGVPELAEKLGRSADVADCFARQWLKYSYGISENEQSRALARAISSELGASGMPIRALLKRLAASPHFMRRRAERPAPYDIPDSPPPPMTGGPPSSGDAGPAPGPSTTPGLEVTVRESEYGGGDYQKDVVVKNKTQSPLDWTVVIPARGSVTNRWNAELSVVGTSFVFTGASYNRTLAPGASTNFGFQGK